MLDNICNILSMFAEKTSAGIFLYCSLIYASDRPVASNQLTIFFGFFQFPVKLVQVTFFLKKFVSSN